MSLKTATLAKPSSRRLFIDPQALLPQSKPVEHQKKLGLNAHAVAGYLRYNSQTDNIPIVSSANAAQKMSSKTFMYAETRNAKNSSCFSGVNSWNHRQSSFRRHRTYCGFPFSYITCV